AHSACRRAGMSGEVPAGERARALRATDARRVAPHAPPRLFGLRAACRPSASRHDCCVCFNEQSGGAAMNRRTVAESPGKPGADEVDVVLVGAGIMSTTLGVLLKELQPDLRIEMFEVLEREAQESSSAWNNAGTGHAALCELNYTPPRSDGSIDISKALEVNVEFDLSRQ